jgi:RNA polymerase-binding protein DksA
MPMIEALREELLARRRALVRQMGRVEGDLHWLETDVESETEERGQEENVARVLARLDDRERDELEAIERALRRIEGGDYGRCATCGNMIALARLRALPAVDECRACAERRERPGG